MQAIILAAGMGKRLKELTQNNTKCMVSVNGVTLIERMLHQIDQHHLTRIVIVVGYEGMKLIDYIETLDVKTPLIFIKNPVYDKTNNIYSLSLAKDYLLMEDTLLFESDIIVEDEILDMLVRDPRDTLALVDRFEPWMDGTCVKLNDEDRIEAFVPGKLFDYSETEQYYKTVNIYKFSRTFSETYYVPFLMAYQKALGENEYYEQVLRVITMLDEPMIKAKRLNGQKWYEIDDVQDLDIAESIFSQGKEHVRKIQSRYGGYWRYPKLLDFCYLVNPFFPPEKLKAEMRTSFDTLLTEYPSGMSVNSLVAGKVFNVRQENIIIGNGAAELIKALMERLKGKTGFVRPTFEEYLHRYSETESVCYYPDNKDCMYDENDLISFFHMHCVDNLVIVNPDNPSGNYISHEGVLRLIYWTKQEGIRLILDESFVDFADEENATMLIQSILLDNPHLFVVKSLSKSYGVPGLRLGILASGDRNTIATLKKDVSIWNINSFAEFFMQIIEKYKKDYAISLEKLRGERHRFEMELAGIPGVRVIPSQANYVMVELTSRMNALELTDVLLGKYELFVKELTQKVGNRYLRLSLRSPQENDRLIQALRAEIDVRTNDRTESDEDE